MAMSGFVCHDDYYDRLKRLTNEEVGHLFRQLMLYHAGRYDEMEAFIDNEGIAFDFIASDIDRMEEKYNATCETNRQNGLKGGRPKNPTKPKETEKNPTKPTEIEHKPTETDRNPTKPYKDKDKEKDKEKDKSLSSSSFIADAEATGILLDHNRVIDAAEDAGFKMGNTVRASLIQMYAEHGLDKVLDGIRECVTHGAPNLAYLGAVLKGKPKKPVKVLPAQQYEQRDYSGVQAEIESELDREMEEYMKSQRDTG
ncbi:MAG: hypothetical protein IIZ93_08170 [Acidaminococcaceae bacterium]|nr:hypothetical protein [Acidaminococcaceae bacterium]